MFPVKGLSISAEKLKVEGQGPTATTTVTSASKPATSGSAKKRKRQTNTENVTAANLAELWEKVIEHKAPPGAADKADAKKNKRQKQSHEPAAAGKQERKEKKQDKKDKKDKRKAGLSSSRAPPTKTAEDETDEWSGIDDDVQQPDQEQADKKKKKDKQQKHGDGSKEDTNPQQPADQKSNSKQTAPAPAPAPPAPAAPKLTPLQASMREKLISARFRHLNETLYTRPSAEAFQLFEDSPEMFTEYHEGFRRQVDVWPENPVDTYIADIKARAKVRFPPRQRNPNQPLTLTPAQLPLPKAMGSKTCTIADLGCGDAKLAAALQPLAHKLRLDLHSFDLQTGGSPLVTRADVANLPLADGSVDVAIFCLALMGTNWLDFVEEAYRVLRWRGELWVAEIKSRFAGPGQQSTKKGGGGGGGAAGGGGGGVVSHSVGHRRKGATPINVAASKKKRQEDAAAAEAEDEAELAVQVDGAESARSRGQETDISAFVEALRKRGFLLNRDLGEAAVDMGNKMFVRMHFVKAAPAVKGKCAVEEKAGQGQGQQGHGHGQGQRHGPQGMRGKGGAGPAMMKKFIGDDEGDGGGANEAAVLKPCVYKIR